METHLYGFFIFPARNHRHSRGDVCYNGDIISGAEVPGRGRPALPRPADLLSRPNMRIIQKGLT